MTEIIEKAKELGALLQGSEQVQKYNAAKRPKSWSKNSICIE